MDTAYKANIAYDVEDTTVTYSEETSLYLNKKNEINIASTFSGEEIVRYRNLYNKRFSFWYLSKTNNFASYSNLISYVNDNDLVVAGIPIPKHKGLLVDLGIHVMNIKYHKKMIECFKHEVTIELEVEKPVLYTKVPIKGYYFKHPSTGCPVRIQFSSDPDYFIRNSKKYPLAVHIENGYGFYSEDRPDLNVMRPKYLTKEGHLVLDDNEVEYIECMDRRTCNWDCLKLPKESRDSACYTETPIETFSNKQDEGNE
jgi:hypothetical protein